MQTHKNLISLAILSMSMLATAQHARAVSAQIDLSEIDNLTAALEKGIEFRFNPYPSPRTTATGIGALVFGMGGYQVARRDDKPRYRDISLMALGLVFMALANGDSILEVLFPTGEK